MAYDTIAVEHDGRVAILTFNRPKVLNAFDPALVTETMDALAALGRDESVSAIVVRGAGRAFSAGFDLKAGAATAGQRGPAEWRRVLEADFDFIMGFWNCPKPTIAAVHGYCIGGAFELSLACDVTVAAQATKFGSPEVKFGSGRGGAAAAVDRRAEGGEGAAAHRRRSADGRPRAGARHRQPCRCRTATAFDRALAIARDMATAAPLAVRLTKLAINRDFDAMGLRAALAAALEIDIFIESAGGPERAEFDRIRREQGLKAAIEWRDSGRGGVLR